MKQDNLKNLRYDKYLNTGCISFFSIIFFCYLIAAMTGKYIIMISGIILGFSIWLYFISKKISIEEEKLIRRNYEKNKNNGRNDLLKLSDKTIARKTVKLTKNMIRNK